MNKINQWILLNYVEDDVLNFAWYNVWDELELEIHFTRDNGALLTVYPEPNPHPEGIRISWESAEHLVGHRVDLDTAGLEFDLDADWKITEIKPKG